MPGMLQTLDLGSNFHVVAPKNNQYKAVPSVQSQLSVSFRGSIHPNVQNECRAI